MSSFASGLQTKIDDQNFAKYIKCNYPPDHVVNSRIRLNITYNISYSLKIFDKQLSKKYYDNKDKFMEDYKKKKRRG